MKPYPKTLAPAYKRKWRREESKKVQLWIPAIGGKCCEKNQSPYFSWNLFFFSELEKNRVHKKWGPEFFSNHFPSMSIAEIFGLLSPSLPLVYWSQGFRYGFLAYNGILICTRPNIFKTLLQKRGTWCGLPFYIIFTGQSHSQRKGRRFQGSLQNEWRRIKGIRKYCHVAHKWTPTQQDCWPTRTQDRSEMFTDRN